MVGIFIVMCVVVIGLGTFTDMGRTITKTVGGMLIKDKLKDPKLAASVYDQGIAKLQDKYGEASDTLEKVQGQVVEYNAKLTKSATELEKIEKDCEILAKNGNMDGLKIKADKRSTLQQQIVSYKQRLMDLEPILTESKNIHITLQKQIGELKNTKDLRISELELSNSMKDTYHSLDKLRADDSTAKLLNMVNDNVEESKRQAAGAQVVHNNRLDVQDAKVDESINSAENDEYVQSLIAKYNK